VKKPPGRADVLAYVAANPGRADRRSITRALGVTGAAKSALLTLLREMTHDGSLGGRPRRSSGQLPPVAVLRVEGADREGELLARVEGGEGPLIGLVPVPGMAPGRGDRVLARLRRSAEGWEGRVMRILPAPETRIIGIYRAPDRIVPVDRRSARDWRAEPGSGAVDGELVEAEARPGQTRVQITARLGDARGPGAVSRIAIREHGLPEVFSDAALAEAAAAKPATLRGRDDLRHIPFVTIDPDDARDHDDAVAAAAEGGNWRIHVAIADVAAYVRPCSALDAEARLRGNSAYFPDRVVPMLPEALSADLCSLREGQDRPCLVAEILVDGLGRVLEKRFRRALITSRARLTYAEAEAAATGQPGGKAAPLMEAAIRPLWAAWGALSKERRRRQPMDLDLPERKIVLSPEGQITSVAFRERLSSHRLIEDYMILANVAAAETLAAARRPQILRVHEEPNPLKVEALRELAESLGLTLAKGQVLKTSAFNRLLAAARDGEAAAMVNMAVLRTMTQAYYSPLPIPHFALNLKLYAHFTSPIRRYADLVVHRSLIALHGWGGDGLTAAEVEALPATAEHISGTERRAMLAERDTNDRYLAAFMAERTGAEFAGLVSGVARFGIFVRLTETGAEGLIPLSRLGRGHWRFDADRQVLAEGRSGRQIAPGMAALVRLEEADPSSGGLIFDLLEVSGRALAAPGPARRKAPRGAETRAKLRRAKLAKKAGRKR
jgi:ribonuclease R